MNAYINTKFKKWYNNHGLYLTKQAHEYVLCKDVSIMRNA